MSLFPDSKTAGSPIPCRPGPGEGAALVEFELEGLKFTALDGGPMYQLTPAVSFVVSCESQNEIDHYWDGLLEDGGEAQQCGWLVDAYRPVVADRPGGVGGLDGAGAGTGDGGAAGDGQDRPGAPAGGGMRDKVGGTVAIYWMS